MTRFLNKVSIITGASSGIGRSTAIHFASLGSSLSLHGRDLSALQATKEACLRANKNLEEDKVLLVQGDLMDDSVPSSIVEKTVKKFGCIDILVNSAGIIGTGEVESTDMDLYDRIMKINVRSVFRLIQLSIPHLKQTRGSIVNVSSVNGIRSFKGVAAYCMSKSALDQLTRCCAIELASSGVRVNSVNPGVIETAIHRRGGMNEEQYQAFLERCKTTHAMGRHGQPEEVAKAIAFLASDEASFTTGELFSIDGGRNILCPR